MDQGLLPRRYAKALYKFAVEKNMAAQVYAHMQTLVHSMEEFPQLQNTISNPYIAPAKKVELAVEAANAKDCPEVADFIKLLIKNRRVELLMSAALAYNSLYRTLNHICLVNIESAAPLEDNTRKRIVALVDRNLNGQTAQYSYTVNPDLIGGFVVNIDNAQLDASVRNELRRMRQTLLA